MVYGIIKYRLLVLLGGGYVPDSNITKKALSAAMKRLMNDKPFSKISVGDICDECGMNRKSFYYHFKDKYSLVNWIYYTEFVDTIYGRPYEDAWTLIEDICSYFYENKRFYTNALQVTGQNSFRDYFAEVLHPIILIYLREIFSKSSDLEFFEIFFTDAMLAALERWLMGSPCLAPDNFITLLRNTITCVALKIVKDIEKEEQYMAP